MLSWIKFLSWYTIVLLGLGILSVPFYYDVPLSLSEAILGVFLMMPVLAQCVLVLLHVRREQQTN